MKFIKPKQILKRPKSFIHGTVASKDMRLPRKFISKIHAFQGRVDFVWRHDKEPIVQYHQFGNQE